MLKKSNLNPLKILGAFPFFEIIYRFFYARSLRILKKSLGDIEGIEDVYLTSDTKSKDFIFGVSDYNIFVLNKNHGHPKRSIREIRKKIKKSRISTYVINTDFIPSLTLDEFKVSRFKAYLLRNSSRDLITWNSILNKDKTIEIDTTDTSQYPLIYSAMRDLDAGLFKEEQLNTKRTQVKNISRSLRALDKFYPSDFSISKPYFNRAKIFLRYPALLSFWHNSFLKYSWKELLPATSIQSGKHSPNHLRMNRDSKAALTNIMSFRFIDDITITPSLIQLEPERSTGKYFIEIHVNQYFCRKNFFDKRQAIKKEIESYQSDDLKFRIRFISSHILKFQLKIMATPFPLDALYRQYKCYSLKRVDYFQGVDQTFLKEAAVNFFIIQFMRFRSSKQKTDLIGSKYVKSINLMYRFHLLGQYLKHGKVEFTDNIEEIKHLLSPQLAHIDPLETVREEDWMIIRAQLIHFLKNIRTQLLKFDKNLSHLRF